MGSHDPFGHWNTSYGQKKGWKSNHQFDSQPLKVGSRPDFLACRWHVTYCWKILNNGYDFFSNLISIKGLHTRLWAPKVTGVLIVRISRFQHRNLGTKWHLGVGPVARHKENYKGEGGAFPQVQAMVSLVNPCLPMVRSCTKNDLATH
jgi:hypothetical protein